MLGLEQIESIGNKELKEQEYSTAIYGHVNQHIEEHISSTLREIYDALISYNNSEHLSNDEAIGNMAKRFQESIKNAKKNKVMFSVPRHIDIFKEREKLSIIEYSMKVLRHLMEYDANVTEVGRSKPQPLWLEMSDLVSKGNSVSTSVFQSERLPSTLQKRKDYLSNLKQIVCDSIENDKKDGVIMERDNGLYYIQCPEGSVITPAKFLSNLEFQNLDGALKIGEGDDVIRIQDGKYHDIKGRFQMTFPISNSEKIVMTLSSEKADKPENASSFGKIMVHMDDKSCKIFLKYLKELEKEPRISKVVEAAKSFVEEKNGKQSEPFSVLEEVSAFKCAHCNHHL